MPVQRVCRPNRTFRGFQGQIEAGCIGIGDELTALPSGEKARIKGILVGDRESARAYKGQPVTVTLDKEVDVSRGCVLVKDTDLAVYKHLTVSLLWMADDSMTPGGEYIVKLGTKTAIGTVKSIDYAINVNTGEKQPAESLEKNSLALVQVNLAEPIAADSFDIIVLRDKAAVTVRDGILTAITVLDEYKYTRYPVINGRGFEALVRSAEDAAELIDEYEKTDGSSAEFFKKWLKFDTYRKVIFR